MNISLDVKKEKIKCNDGLYAVISKSQKDNKEYLEVEKKFNNGLTIILIENPENKGKLIHIFLYKNKFVSYNLVAKIDAIKVAKTTSQFGAITALWLCSKNVKSESFTSEKSAKAKEILAEIKKDSPSLLCRISDFFKGSNNRNY